MNGEHLQDLRGGGSGQRTEANGHGDDLDRALCDAWAVGMVLAAYDHVLFHPWRPGEEAMWSASLQALLGARERILAEAIPLRLRSYRCDSLPATPEHVS
jgi:hypothetical protein